MSFAVGRSRHGGGLRQAAAGISANVECHVVFDTCGVETMECRTRELFRQIKPFDTRPCIPRDIDEHRALHAAGERRAWPNGPVRTA